MATNEANVQVALDGAGKKIRQLKLTGVVQADGTTADVYVQCVAITDTDGAAVGMQETNGLLRQLIAEMQALRKMYGIATGQMWHSADASGDDQGFG